MNSSRFHLFLFLLLGQPWLNPLVVGDEKKKAAARPEAIMAKKHFEIFEKYCLDCHDSDTEKGGVNLDDLAFEIDSIEAAELWQKVLNATNSGEMPPEKKDQLTDDEKTEFLSDLSRELVVARDVLGDSGGVITMRRLNRREYENTIEALLGVKVDASDLPDDSNPGGFDTAGSALFFSSDQFEQYIKIARRALDEAMIFGDKPKSKTFRVQPEDSIGKFIRKQAGKLRADWDRAQAWRNSGGKPPTEFGFIDADRVVFEERQYKLNYPTFQQYLDNPLSENGVLLYNFFRGCVGPKINAPKTVGGKYIVRAKIAVLSDDIPERRRFVEYGNVSSGARSGEINVQGFQKIVGTLDQPQIIEFEFEPEGDDRTFMIRERHINNAEATKRFFTASWSQNKLGPPPALWVDWIEIEGPLYENWPPQKHNALFVPRSKDVSHHKHFRSVLTEFATKAFRTREPSKSYVDKLMKLYYSKTKSGMKSSNAVKDVLSIVLASPGFLYIQEPSNGEKRRELSATELAVRLSYFLWSAPPDDILVSSARTGKLMDPKELKLQVNRMLKDSRSEEFVEGFAHQWLHMERLDFFQFNYQKFPAFDSSVKESARQEVYEMIKDGILNDRPIVELLKSDHVMLNNLLAHYYGIAGVEGEHFRRVPVPEGFPRGGLLGAAAVMAMGSDGEKASPVERGAWILRFLLNNPPPPAPANVPQLSRLAGKPLNAREMISAHMEEPQCAQCHRIIDPLGFGLQNFDAAGLWREAEIFKLKGADAKRARKKGKPVVLKFPVDASGTMPDGSEFNDFFQLRDRVAEHEKAFARGFTENLIEYALGRPFGFTDQNMADTIMRRAAKKDYAMTEFILGAVQSKRFKLK